MFLVLQCCSNSVLLFMLQVMLLPTLNIVYIFISSALLEAQFVCSDQHGYFLQFLVFALSQYFAQIFSEPFFQMVPFAPVITGMAFVLIFHMICVSVVRFLLQDFLISFLYHTSVCLQKLQEQIGYMFLFVLSRIMVSGLLLRAVLFLYTLDSIMCLPYLQFKICLLSYYYHFA